MLCQESPPSIHRDTENWRNNRMAASQRRPSRLTRGHAQKSSFSNVACLLEAYRPLAPRCLSLRISHIVINPKPQVKL